PRRAATTRHAAGRNAEGVSAHRRQKRDQFPRAVDRSVALPDATPGARLAIEPASAYRCAGTTLSPRRRLNRATSTSARPLPGRKLGDLTPDEFDKLLRLLETFCGTSGRPSAP